MIAIWPFQDVIISSWGKYWYEKLSYCKNKLKRIKSEMQERLAHALDIPEQELKTSYANSPPLSVSLLHFDFRSHIYYKMKILLHFLSFSQWISIVPHITIKIFLFHSMNRFMRTKPSFCCCTSMCLNDFWQYYILTNYMFSQSRTSLVSEALNYMVYKLIVKK